MNVPNRMDDYIERYTKMERDLAAAQAEIERLRGENDKLCEQLACLGTLPSQAYVLALKGQLATAVEALESVVDNCGDYGREGAHKALRAARAALKALRDKGEGKL